jgi:hypothetical protein
MRPLYDARIEDLGPGDFVRVECACGHIERLTAAMLTTVGVMPDYSGERASIVEGKSPNSALYSPANRPNCQKPYCVAISVTVVAVGALS